MSANTPLFITPPLAAKMEMTHAQRGIHYARAYHKLHPETECQIESINGGFLIYGGERVPVNSARCLGLFAPVCPDNLDYVEQFYHSRGWVSRIDLCPLADPSLMELTSARGYVLTEFYSVLIRPLTGADQPPTLPPGVIISLAQPEQADSWLTTVGQGFESTSERPPEAVYEILGPNFHAANGTCFFAWVDGQPAGGGGMYIHEDVVELGGASTRPEFRRRGVHRALVEARLVEARARGCAYATVITKPGSDSQRSAERLGFRLAYTRADLIKEPGS
jgi:GNAT superfamily N-acetyltransferase